MLRAVCNTAVLNALERIDMLEVLKVLFDDVVVPDACFSAGSLYLGWGGQCELLWGVASPSGSCPRCYFFSCRMR